MIACRIAFVKQADYLKFNLYKYQGVISLESVYRPDNGTSEGDFWECLPVFKKLFGN